MTTYISPFDFQTILVNKLSGSWIIFIFISLIAISILAAKFRLPDKAFLMLLILFGIMMAPQIGMLYVLMVIIIGLVVYHGISKIVKQ